jgi:hypothetical protein
VISEPEHTGRSEPDWAQVALILLLNVLVVTAALVIGYFGGVPVSYSWTVIIIVVILADIAFLAYSSKQNGMRDTLNFRFTVVEGGRAAGAAAYKDIVRRTERYLAQNRLTAVARDTSSRWPGPLKTRSTAFTLGGTDLTLNVMYRESGARYVILAIGPVADGKDNVARNLLEGLRRELLDAEEDAPPEKRP